MSKCKHKKVYRPDDYNNKDTRSIKYLSYDDNETYVQLRPWACKKCGIQMFDGWPMTKYQYYIINSSHFMRNDLQQNNIILKKRWWW